MRRVLLMVAVLLSSIVRADAPLPVRSFASITYGGACNVSGLWYGVAQSRWFDCTAGHWAYSSATAAALAADPSDCSSGQYATGIASDGDLTCSAVSGFLPMTGGALTGALSSTPSTTTPAPAFTAKVTATPSTSTNSSYFVWEAQAQDGPRSVASWADPVDYAYEPVTWALADDDGMGGWNAPFFSVSSDGFVHTQLDSATIYAKTYICSSEMLLTGVGQTVDTTQSSAVSVKNTGANGFISGWYDASNNLEMKLANNGALSIRNGTGTLQTVATTLSTVAAASALAADPTDCSANQYATGIAASGNLTCGGFALTGPITSTGLATAVSTTFQLTGPITSTGVATAVGTGFQLTGPITSTGVATAVGTDFQLSGAITSVGLATTMSTAESSTSTFTNKTMDVEATGNVFTITNTWYSQAGQCNASTSTMGSWNLPTSNTAVGGCYAGSNVKVPAVLYSDGSLQKAGTTFALPTTWTGTIDLRLFWMSSTSDAGVNVEWCVATACAGDGETVDPSYNAAQCTIDANKASAYLSNTFSITGLTMTGCAAGGMLYILVSRDAQAGNGNDTLAGSAWLRGIELTYRRAL